MSAEYQKMYLMKNKVKPPYKDVEMNVYFGAGFHHQMHHLKDVVMDLEGEESEYKPAHLGPINKSSVDKIEEFMKELNHLTHQTPGPKEGKGSKTALKGRLTNEQIISLAKLKGLSALVLPGWDQWCPSFGGYWRTIAVEMKADQENSMSNIRAMIIEDCDSPHLAENFQLFLK